MTRARCSRRSRPGAERKSGFAFRAVNGCTLSYRSRVDWPIFSPRIEIGDPRGSLASQFCRSPGSPRRQMIWAASASGSFFSTTTQWRFRLAFVSCIHTRLNTQAPAIAMPTPQRVADYRASKRATANSRKFSCRLGTAAGATPNAWITTMALVHLRAPQTWLVERGRDGTGGYPDKSSDRKACRSKEAESRTKVDGIDFLPLDIGVRPLVTGAAPTLASAASPNASGPRCRASTTNAPNMAICRPQVLTAA